MKKLRLKYNPLIAWVLVLCMVFQVTPVFAQDSPYIVFTNEFGAEFTETHYLAGTEWIHTFHDDGTLTITPEGQYFTILLNSDGEVFVETTGATVVILGDEFSIPVYSPIQSFQVAPEMNIEASKTHVMTLREFNDSALEVDVFNGIDDEVTSIISENVASISSEAVPISLYQQSLDYFGIQGLNYFGVFEPHLVITLSTATILALLALTTLVMFSITFTAANPIMGNMNVRREIEFMGSGAAMITRDLINAVNVVFSNTINANNINTNFHNHHIVAQTAAAAQPARNVLNSVNPVIGINSHENLVPLRASFHSRLHTNAYYSSVNALITVNTNNNRNTVVNRLNFIRVVLQAASGGIPMQSR